MQPINKDVFTEKKILRVLSVTKETRKNNAWYKKWFDNYSRA